MRKVVVVLTVLFVFGAGCTASGSSAKDEKEMKELTVKSDKGSVVMKGNVLNGRMEGECIWYDGVGNPISKGVFRDGKPFSGTFVDWSLEFKELKNDPFEPKEYAKDWVTFYETSFLSQKIDYSRLLIEFEQGIKQ